MNLELYRVGQIESIHYVPDWISSSEEEFLLKSIHSSKTGWKCVSGRKLRAFGGTVFPAGLCKAPMPQWAKEVADKVSSFSRIFGGNANHILVNSYLPGQGIHPHEDGPLYYPAVAILSLGSTATLRFWLKNQDTMAESSLGFSKETGLSGTKNTYGREHGSFSSCRSSNTDSCGHTSNSGTPPLGCLCSVVCQPRSLLLFQHTAYTHSLHGIDFAPEDTVDSSTANAAQLGLQEGDTVPRAGLRTSLTLRRVPRSCGVRIQL